MKALMDEAQRNGHEPNHLQKLQIVTPEEKDRLIQKRIASVGVNGEKELDLSSLGLITIPEAVFALDKLETFKFMNNYLTEIPVGLTQMRRLKALYLYNNRIQHVDKRLLVELPYLDCLDLGGNPFDYYAAIDYFYKHNPWQGYIKCLNKIERAKKHQDDRFMYFGKMHVFPKEVFELTNLTSLAIYGEEITEMPAGISSLANLRVLDLSGNKLNALPEDIAGLTKLEHIRLDSNRFEEFPGIILRIPSLKYIHLNNNQLENFPLRVIYDERFVTVDALGNPIKNFSSSLFNLPLEEMRERLRHQ